MIISRNRPGWTEVPCSSCDAKVPVPEAEPNRYYGNPITCLECQDKQAEPRPARYSGPDRKGICVCGHKWVHHHLGIVVRPGATKVVSESGWQGREGYIPQECEYFGSNEMGGLDVDGHVHCFGYRDASKEGV